MNLATFVKGLVLSLLAALWVPTVLGMVLQAKVIAQRVPTGSSLLQQAAVTVQRALLVLRALLCLRHPQFVKRALLAGDLPQHAVLVIPALTPASRAPASAPCALRAPIALLSQMHQRRVLQDIILEFK